MSVLRPFRATDLLKFNNMQVETTWLVPCTDAFMFSLAI